MKLQPILLSVEEKDHLQVHLLNAVEEAIFAVDLDGHIVFWNHSAENLYGWTIEEVQGRDIVVVLASPLLMESARANLGQLPAQERLVWRLSRSKARWYCFQGISQCLNH